MSVHPGREPVYERRYHPTWPELEEVLRQHWVHNHRGLPTLVDPRE